LLSLPQTQSKIYGRTEWKDKKGSEQKVGATSPTSPSFSPLFELPELHSHKDGQSYWPSVPSSPEPAQTLHNKSELVPPSTTTNRTVFWEFSVHIQERSRLLLAGVSSCQELVFGAHLQEETA